MRPRLAQKQAALLKTSQSRLARMEAGGLSVSLDLLVRGLFALGASSKDPKGSLILRSGLPETFELRLRSQQSASRGCSRTSSPLCDFRKSQPRRSASIAATSILPIFIIALKTRFAAARSGSVTPLSRATGAICQDTPHLSLHQLHALS